MNILSVKNKDNFLKNTFLFLMVFLPISFVVIFNIYLSNLKTSLMQRMKMIDMNIAEINNQKSFEFNEINKKISFNNLMEVALKKDMIKNEKMDYLSIKIKPWLEEVASLR